MAIAGLSFRTAFCSLLCLQPKNPMSGYESLLNRYTFISFSNGHILLVRSSSIISDHTSRQKSKHYLYYVGMTSRTDALAIAAARLFQSADVQSGEGAREKEVAEGAKWVVCHLPRVLNLCIMSSFGELSITILSYLLDNNYIPCPQDTKPSHRIPLSS